jgi:hypothetical protein
MKMTPTRRNTLRILKGAIDRAFAKMVAHGKRKVLDKPSMWREADMAGPALDNLFSTMAGATMAKLFKDVRDENLRSLLATLARFAYTGAEQQRRFEAHLIEELRANATEYELMAQMPLPRRERKTRVPKTLVERRAEKADAKVAEWERKLKYAKTKLAAYRKKQKYYAKKGAAV